MIIGRKTVSIGVLIVVSIGFLIVYGSLIRPFLVRENDLEQQIREAEGKFQSYFDRERYPYGPPSRELCLYLETVRVAMEDRYEVARRKLELGKEGLLPEEVRRPEIFYLEQLKRMKEDLQMKAKAAGVELGSSLGLPEGLPKEEDVPDLLRRMDVVRELVEVAIELGISNIGGIRVEMTDPLRILAGIKKPRPEVGPPSFEIGGPPFEGRGPLPVEPEVEVSRSETGITESLPREMKVEMSLDGNISLLLGFLHRIQSGSYFFILKKVKLDKGSKAELKAQISIRALYILLDKKEMGEYAI